MKVGDLIHGRFAIQRFVARGGMGEVYLAEDHETRGRVALKVLAGEDDDLAERLGIEARALLELNHPAIVRYVAHGVAPGVGVYLAMEWLDGATLAQRLQRQPLSVDETLTLIRFRLGLAAAAAWWRQIEGSTRLRWERVDHDRFERARNLFFQYRDKDLSFTDCSSMAVMKELKVKTVITTDRHFQQVGFDVLPSLRSRKAGKPRRS